MCLDDLDYNSGTCCAPNEPDANIRDLCKIQEKMTFCSSAGTIKHPYLQDWTCPASKDYCPTEESDINIKIDKEASEVNKEWIFNFPVPTFKAVFNCKYKITVARDLVNKVDPEERGWIMLQMEQYGFDEDVIVMVQPFEKFEDHYINTDLTKSSRIYRSIFGTKFYLPAESEVLILFAPVRNKEGSTRGQSLSGKLKLRTWY